jgi:hypothetical protein
VYAAPAPLLELEVLDHVREVDLLAFDSGSLERSVQLPAGGADEGLPGAILFVTGLLAHKHQARALQALAEDGLGGVAPQVAAATAHRRLA